MKNLLLLLSIFPLTLAAQVNDSTKIKAVAPDSSQDRSISMTVLGIGTKHAQVALIGNIAPRDFSGTQLSPVFNVACGKMTGLQACGVLNHANDSLNGVQLAGAVNTVHGNMSGLQAAGAINVCDGTVNGGQLAGAINVTADTMKFFQAAGAANYATHMTGVQVAGAMNVVAGTMRGVQISGAVNYARKMEGMQIGVFNFADSVSDKAVMLGIFSYSRQGYHKLEFGWNEALPINGAFITGSKKFHNIFSIGCDFGPRQPLWGFGYGIGTAWGIFKRGDLDISLSQTHVNKGGFTAYVSSLWKLSTVVDFHLTDKISLAAGPTLNVFITDLFPTYNEPAVTGFVPYYFFTQTYDNRWNAKAWVGFTASVRFF
jgi:hypothetical protein